MMNKMYFAEGERVCSSVGGGFAGEPWDNLGKQAEPLDGSGYDVLRKRQQKGVKGAFKCMGDGPENLQERNYLNQAHINFNNMAIIYKDGFCFFELSKNNVSMIMDKRTDDIVKYVDLNRVESLTIQTNLRDIIPEKAVQEYLFSDITEVGFLERMPTLTEIRLIDVGQCDIEGIYFLGDLKKLTIVNSHNRPSKNIVVEFNRFADLEEINVDWFSNDFDISENKELKTLLIRKFNPTSGDFSGLQLPSKLSKMEIVHSNIQNLCGIHSDTLESLELSYCSQITSLRGINEISGKLNKLIIESAAHLSEYTEIESCRLLQDVAFVKCGDMMSLEWVKSLPNLSHLVLDRTSVVNEDIKNLLNIDRVFFTNKKHYNCKCVISPENENWKYKAVEIF